MVTPVVLHFIRQTSHDALHAVLHIDGGQVERPGQLEGDVDGAAAIVAAGGGHVAHVLHAVDGLFQNGGHRGFDRGGICAGVKRSHRDLRRRQLRKLRDRKKRDAHRSRDHDEQRGYGGKDRALNEEISKQTECPLYAESSVGSARLRRASHEAVRIRARLQTAEFTAAFKLPSARLKSCPDTNHSPDNYC